MEFENEDMLEENVTLSSDAIQEDVGNLLRNKLGSEEWSPSKVDGWVDDIINSVLKDFADAKKPFKYIVNCVIMQKTGASLSTGFISLWDNAKDGVVHVPYENDSLHCLLTIFFLKID